MSSLYNHTPPRQINNGRNIEKTEEKLIKNFECIDCKNMYECKGKPRSTVRCVNYIQRATNIGD